MRRLSSSTRQVALGVADQVDAGDVDAHVARRTHAAKLREPALRREDQIRRHLAVGEDALVAVQVVEEELEGAHPLDEPALQGRPVGRRDHPRDQAEREDLLGAPLVGVDREGDPLVEERALGQSLAHREAGAGVGSEGVEGLAEGRPGGSTRSEQLVPGPGEPGVVGEERRGGVHGGSGVSQVGSAAGRRRRSRVRRADGARKGLRKRPGRTTTRSSRRRPASAASAGRSS